jgi:two-component system cell cycle sensor histidine kinase/response regulator CckA
MQAVGQLAGGVAHDFNNLLTAMIGFCDLLLMRHPAGDPSFADIMQVKQNANRAANLVRQLLAFSRKQTLQPTPVDLSEVLAEISNLIRRLIGENIQLRMVHGRDIGVVKADQGQLEQVLINLAVNARDAMKDGGTLTIRTSNTTLRDARDLDRAYISPTEEEQIMPGDYVWVEVEDTGTGIPPEIIKSIFEPFFSTKEVGSGTGLGLATCYGIIKQTGGYIYVKSTPGVGTNFSLFLPRMQQEATATKPVEITEESKTTDLTGKATILLVEDETPVRIFAARALRNKGYEVLEADNGESAIETFNAHTGAIDLIISDVVMPGMNGPKMIKSLEESAPERMAKLAIVFISGYAEDAFLDTFGADRSFNFLPKPFTLKQLAGKVKDVLDSAAAQ